MSELAFALFLPFFILSVFCWMIIKFGASDGSAPELEHEPEPEVDLSALARSIGFDGDWKGDGKRPWNWLGEMKTKNVHATATISYGLSGLSRLDQPSGTLDVEAKAVTSLPDGVTISDSRGRLVGPDTFEWAYQVAGDWDEKARALTPEFVDALMADDPAEYRSFWAQGDTMTFEFHDVRGTLNSHERSSRVQEALTRIFEAWPTSMKTHREVYLEAARQEGKHTLEAAVSLLLSHPRSREAEELCAEFEELPEKTRWAVAAYSTSWSEQMDRSRHRQVLRRAILNAGHDALVEKARSMLCTHHGWSVLTDSSQDDRMRYAAAKNAWGDASAPVEAERLVELTRILSTKRHTWFDTARVYRALRAGGLDPKIEWLTALVPAANRTLQKAILEDVMRRGAVTDWAPVFAALEKEGMEVSEQMGRIREVAGSGRLSIADDRGRGGLTSAGEAGGLEMHHEKDA